MMTISEQPEETLSTSAAIFWSLKKFLHQRHTNSSLMPSIGQKKHQFASILWDPSDLLRKNHLKL